MEILGFEEMGWTRIKVTIDDVGSIKTDYRGVKV